jgi:hypothetical protein
MNKSKDFAVFIDDNLKNQNFNFDDVIIEKALMVDSVIDENNENAQNENDEEILRANEDMILISDNIF